MPLWRKDFQMSHLVVRKLLVAPLIVQTCCVRVSMVSGWSWPTWPDDNDETVVRITAGLLKSSQDVHLVTPCRGDCQTPCIGHSSTDEAPV